MKRFEKGAGKAGSPDSVNVKMLLSHATYEWISVARARDRRPRAERPSISHIAEALCVEGFELLQNSGIKPTFVEHKVRGALADTKKVGEILQFHCPRGLHTTLKALRAQVNGGAYPSEARNKKGVCVSNVARRLIELAIEKRNRETK